MCMNINCDGGAEAVIVSIGPALPLGTGCNAANAERNAWMLFFKCIIIAGTLSVDFSVFMHVAQLH